MTACGLFLATKKRCTKEKGKELQCSLVTNGSLLTEEIVSGLLNYNCKFVQITLDGPEYIHNCRRVAKDGSGTFQKVLHGITIMEELKEPDCSDCKYLPICGGGCRMLSYRQTGTYHAAGCEKVKGVIEKQIEVYVRRQVQFQNN